MAALHAVTPTCTVGFYLVPEFPMIAFAAAIEPLRIANRLSGRALYAWRLISRDGAPVTASNGIALPADHGIADATRCDMVIVCAGLHADTFRDRAVFAWLRRLARAGCRLGAISTGTYLLARSGLLDGRRCTIHWESVAALAEQFPLLSVTDDIFAVDGSIITCSGGTGSLDMMLHIVAERHDAALVAGISDQLMHPRIRGQHDHQRRAMRVRLGMSHPRLAALVQAMEAAAEEKLDIGRLARSAGLSPRHAERLCERHLGMTPARAYLKIRLRRGQGLLRETGLSVLDVALACGFVSASHFSRCYRACFGRSPRDERRQAEIRPAARIAAS